MNQRFHPDPLNPAKHIGIIPDGGRRWAAKKNCSLQESYALTRLKLRTYVPLLLELGLSELSIYLSSKLNFQREEKEIQAFNQEVFQAFLTDFVELSQLFHLSVVAAGDLAPLHDGLKKTIHEVEQQTKDSRSGCINLLINYDPLDEIEQAMASTTQGNTPFWKKLWVNSPLDLVIRSGGANLMSNFLPLQSAYARIYYLEPLFNDLEWSDIRACLTDYQSIDRKYGN